MLATSIPQPNDLSAGRSTSRPVQSTHMPMIFFLSTPMNRPFKEVLPGSQGLGSVDWQRLQNELRSEDYRAVRLDECCHFSPYGHKVLAGVVERVILGHSAEAVAATQ
jgi:hypothetical protein